MFDWYFSPCKCIRTLESGKFLLVESKIREHFARGIRNPGLWNPEWSSSTPKSHEGMESRTQFHWKRLESSTRNPQSTEWDPESKTVFFSLTSGDSTRLRTESHYFRARGAVFKVRWPIHLFWSLVGVGVVGLWTSKNGLPGADSIFLNTVTTHQSFF